jgi:alpha-aminoadipate carrier protein LysW
MVTASCPECAGTITFQAGPPGDTVACPDCGAELEVAALNVSAADMSPEEAEDWGQ